MKKMRDISYNDMVLLTESDLTSRYTAFTLAKFVVDPKPEPWKSDLSDHSQRSSA